MDRVKPGPWKRLRVAVKGMQHIHVGLPAGIGIAVGGCQNLKIIRFLKRERLTGKWDAGYHWQTRLPEGIEGDRRRSVQNAKRPIACRFAQAFRRCAVKVADNRKSNLPAPIPKSLSGVSAPMLTPAANGNPFTQLLYGVFSVLENRKGK